MTDPTNTTPDAASLERRLRLRARFWEYRHVLVIACLVLVGLGAGLGYGAYVAPAETTEQRPVSEWTATGAFSHEATVTESNAIYDEGTVLEDEPLYYTTIAPTVDGTYVAGYDAEAGEDVEVTLTATVQYGAVDPDEETVYWSQRRELDEEHVSDVDPGEEVTMVFELNVSAVENRIETVERELQATPGQTDVYVELEREISGTIDGEPTTETGAELVTIDLEGNTYRIEDDVSFEEVHGRQETVSVPVPPGPLRSVGGPTAVLLGLVGLVGVALGTRRTAPPTSAERAWLDYREAVATVGDLIVDAQLPDPAPDCARVTVSDLESLANVGMDVGSALVYDSETERYVVEDGDRRYVFDPPAREALETTSGREKSGLEWLQGEEEPPEDDRPEGDDRPDGGGSADPFLAYDDSPTEPTDTDFEMPADVTTTAAEPATPGSTRADGDLEPGVDPDLASLAGVATEDRSADSDQNRSSENCSRS